MSWFGSSGGGLPRRPELKSLGRFFCDRPWAPTSYPLEHEGTGTRNWKPATAVSSLCDFCAYDASNTVLRYTQQTLAPGTPGEEMASNGNLHVTNPNFNHNIIKPKHPLLANVSV